VGILESNTKLQFNKLRIYGVEQKSMYVPQNFVTVQNADQQNEYPIAIADTGYCYYSFSDINPVNSKSIEFTKETQCDILVIGGGGGSSDSGAGGGAGGAIYAKNVNIPANTPLDIIIGAGGGYNTAGINTSIINGANEITASGGLAGNNITGGGGSDNIYSTFFNGTITNYVTLDGGIGNIQTPGGGGGIGSKGDSSIKGGDGKYFYITGINKTYCEGGDGSTSTNIGVVKSSYGSGGTAGLGGTGGTGIGGIVILRFKIPFLNIYAGGGDGLLSIGDIPSNSSTSLNGGNGTKDIPILVASGYGSEYYGGGGGGSTLLDTISVTGGNSIGGNGTNIISQNGENGVTNTGSGGGGGSLLGGEGGDGIVIVRFKRTFLYDINSGGGGGGLTSAGGNAINNIPYGGIAGSNTLSSEKIVISPLINLVDAVPNIVDINDNYKYCIGGEGATKTSFGNAAVFDNSYPSSNATQIGSGGGGGAAGEIGGSGGDGIIIIKWTNITTDVIQSDLVATESYVNDYVKYNLADDAASISFVNNQIANVKISQWTDGSNGIYYENNTIIGTNANQSESTSNYRLQVNNSTNDIGLAYDRRTCNLYVKNDIIASAFSQLSDANVKTNVTDLEYNNDLMNLRPVSFNWSSNYYNQQKIGDEDVGLIAQEVEMHIPGLVFDNIMLDGNTWKTVNYTGLIPYMIKHIQHLNKRIETLENTNKRIEILEYKLNNM